MKILEVNIGINRVVIHPDSINIRKIKAIKMAIDDIRKRHDPLNQYPPAEGEERDAYMERVIPLIMDAQKKLEGESDEDYASRLIDMEMEDSIQGIGFDLMVEAIRIFDLKKPITKEEFEEASWFKIRDFLHDLLSAGDIAAASMFRPPTTADQLAS